MNDLSPDSTHDPEAAARVTVSDRRTGDSAATFDTLAAALAWASGRRADAWEIALPGGYYELSRAELILTAGHPDLSLKGADGHLPPRALVRLFDFRPADLPGMCDLIRGLTATGVRFEV